MQEIWKPCFRYEGVYVVSNLGSVARVLPDGSYRKMNPSFRDKQGYRLVKLRDGKKRNLVRVCKLVAIAFLGAGEKWFVRHLDEDIDNNCVSNMDVNERKSNFKVELTHDLLLRTVEYDPDSGLFTKDGEKTGSEKKFSGKWYIQLWLHRKQYLAHRVAVFYMTGKWPPEEVDHRDGNGLNNRFSNLRCCTRLQNCRNCRYSKTRVIGVRLFKNKKWRASIGIGNGKTKTKSFRTRKEAVYQRSEWEKEYGYSEHHGKRKHKDQR